MGRYERFASTPLSRRILQKIQIRLFCVKFMLAKALRVKEGSGGLSD